MIKKLYLLSISLTYFLKYKLLYGTRISMSPINSIKGKFRIEIFHGGEICIGKFLMTLSPLYLKCTEGAQIKIGEKCFFNHNCSITSATKIEIGDHCMFANNLVIVDHDHIIKDDAVSGELKAEPIVIGDNVWVGANVTILKGVKIGNGAVIAAGAVVNKNVEAHTVVGGVPIRNIERKNS